MGAAMEGEWLPGLFDLLTDPTDFSRSISQLTVASTDVQQPDARVDVTIAHVAPGYQKLAR
jgi:hypothetical protein